MSRNDLIGSTIAAVALLTCVPMTRADEPAADDARARWVREKLEMKIPMRFAEPTPLEDVLKYIKIATVRPGDSGIPFFVDPKALQKAGKTMQSPVTYVAEGIPLKTSLRALLEPLGLDYSYSVPDGYLRIATRADTRP